MRKRASLIAAFAVGGTMLSACSFRYDLRDFEIVAQNTPSGSLLINLQSTGHWKERGVRVSGAPYTLLIAARMIDAPSQQCQLIIRSLTLTSETGGRPVVFREQLALRAEPVDPAEPNSRKHSAYFTFVPVEATYMTTGKVESMMLAYEPHRLRFELSGGPTCPTSARQTFRANVTLTPGRTTGISRWWDGIMSV